MYNKIQEVINANIELHTELSDHYNTCEPQYRPENLQRVEKLIKSIISDIDATKALDLGCGTGFVIDILKKYVDEIAGVDVTQAMMDKVDKSGNTKITLYNHDTGTFPVEEGYYDIVTAHSFLHHLYDIVPTINTAAKALRKGGKFFNELDPNFYFWEGVNNLDRNGAFSKIVKTEIENVSFKDEDIESTFGVKKDVFNNAEYGKNVKGGFKEEELTDVLLAAGFSEVKITYHWYLGQASLLNHLGIPKEEATKHADIMDEVLHLSLPLSRNLYKYIGFIATK